MQPARAVRVLVREGDTVLTGDTLAVFAIPTLAASEAQADARLTASRESARELGAGARRQELARAESEVAAADAEAGRAAADLARLEPLAAKGDISKSALGLAAAAARSTAARRDAAKAELSLLTAGARDERRQVAAADVRGAIAASAALRATANDLVLLAPTDGVVLSRNAEPGEVLGVGASAITLGQPTRPWARIFVSQFVLPSLKLGDTLVARLDGDSTAYKGRISAIASKAEFTPRVALTDQERADLLFGVKIEFNDKTQRLKAGLPITVTLPVSTTARVAK
jgi:HlyD family secretion protein